MKNLQLDIDYLKNTLLELLDTPSPTGFTDEVVHYTGNKLEELGISFELTRRGAIRANLRGNDRNPDRAIVAHLDTIGAMVTTLKPNGRLGVSPVGTWSSRFAEGARVTVFTDTGPYRGTILPLMASGHVYDLAIDTQPVAWSNLELRVDEICHDIRDLNRLGFNVGDFIAVDPAPEITENGFINSRFLDDKAGVAALLTVAKAVVENQVELPVDAHLLFTISEEVGSGASGILHRDVAEMVTIDTGPVAPPTNGCEYGVNVCMHDMAGPFDYHLTHKLIGLCQEHGIEHRRNIFPYYRSDSASALESGNDIRTALVCFGADATHGYERTHMSSVIALGELLCYYVQSEPTFRRDEQKLAPLEGFSSLPTE
jgi:peptidase M42 family hydrolase